MSVSRIDTETKGAWIIHHGRKLLLDTHGSADFPAIDVAAKAIVPEPSTGRMRRLSRSVPAFVPIPWARAARGAGARADRGDLHPTRRPLPTVANGCGPGPAAPLMRTASRSAMPWRPPSPASRPRSPARSAPAAFATPAAAPNTARRPDQPGRDPVRRAIWPPDSIGPAFTRPSCPRRQAISRPHGPLSGSQAAISDPSVLRSGRDRGTTCRHGPSCRARTSVSGYSRPAAGPACNLSAGPSRPSGAQQLARTYTQVGRHGRNGGNQNRRTKAEKPEAERSQRSSEFKLATVSKRSIVETDPGGGMAGYGLSATGIFGGAVETASGCTR